MKTKLRPFVLFLLALLPMLPAAAQVPDQLYYSIPAPPTGTQTYAQLGFSVAVEGNFAVVGAPFDDTGGEDSGMVRVFDSATGAPLFVLPNPSPAAGDNFGIWVAISGTRIVVGARLDDTGATDSGSAYVYDISSGTPTVPVLTLHNPSPGNDDEFGNSVAISGTRIVVGASLDNTGATDTGSAYVYDLGSGTPTVPIFTLNNPAPAVFDLFGHSVAISGTRVVVGAIFDDAGEIDAGSAYVYDLGSGTPTVPVATLNNPGPALDDRFGVSVAISGTRVVIGAILDDTGASDAGSAYVYDLSSGTPTVPTATLNNPSPALNDYFGNSVAISGTRVVVGARLDDPGASDAGSAYVYDLSSGAPTLPVATLHNPTPAASDRFGYSVAISGVRVVVGADFHGGGAGSAGSAYVYDLSRGTPTPVNNPSPAAQDSFGYSVAISGTRVVVGAVNDDTGAGNLGSAYVYDLSSGTPTVPVATLNNPSPANIDYFGISVAIDGTTVAIGTPYDDTVAPDKGSAYVFGPSPYSLWKVTDAGDQFAADLGDADSDGLSNLGEYGLLRSPAIPDGAAITAAPVLYGDGRRLRMFVPRDPARYDVTLEVQATGDLLGSWTTIATSTLDAPFTGPGYFGGDAATPGVKSVEVRDVVNTTNAPQRYLRVRVRH